jgi:hypothetical protein
MLATNNIRLEGTQGMERLRTGTSWCQSVAQILSNIKHKLNIESPEEAVHAHE